MECVASDPAVDQPPQSAALRLLRDRWTQRKYVCVGLDTDYDLLPGAARNGSVADSLFRFNRQIIDATSDHVCAYKPNAAFYEKHGPAGIEALVETVQYIKLHLPGVAVILDAKRGDIGNTNSGYAVSAFDIIGAHAITVHPYLGQEALAPFLERRDRLIFVLVKTSNPGAGELQDLPVGSAGRPLYESVARLIAERWNEWGNCGVVVGAPYPLALRNVREIVGGIPILVPGVGVQGGDVAATVRAGADRAGGGIVVNSSRGIIFASSEADFATAAGAAAARLNQEICSAIDR